MVYVFIATLTFTVLVVDFNTLSTNLITDRTVSSHAACEMSTMVLVLNAIIITPVKTGIWHDPL